MPTEPGKLHWNRREGMTVIPEIKAEWKCAGGFYFTTTKDKSGTTIIEMVERNGGPVPC